MRTTTTHLTIETMPSAALVEQRGSTRRVDLSFEIHNPGPKELVLVAIEQDVYDAAGGLVQRRLVDQDEHVGPGERRTIHNPLPEFAAGIPLAALVHTFTLRSSEGDILRSEVRVVPIESRAATPTTLARAPLERAHAVEQADPPTPRQLARLWFETLDDLGAYAAAPLDCR